MATAKPKRMMFGGIAKGAMNSVKKAISNSPAKPMPSAVKQFMSDKLRGASSLAPGLGPRGATTGGGRTAPRPTPIRDIGTGSMPRPGGIPKPGGMGPRPPSQVSGRPVGLGKSMGKKAGGTVKKAVKK